MIFFEVMQSRQSLLSGDLVFIGGALSPLINVTPLSVNKIYL